MGTPNGMLGPKKPLREYSKRELGIAILRCVALGVAVVLVASSPYAASALWRHFRTQNRQERRRLARRVEALKSRGYLDRRKNGKYALTKKARELLQEDAVWSLTIPKPKRWDGRWRMVIFDIPAKQERGRQSLRVRLRELGCVPYQRSVYVYPFELKQTVMKIAAFYGLDRYVRYVRADTLDDEAALRNQFGLD